MGLDFTKAHFRKEVKALKEGIKPSDKPLSVSQLTALYERPGELLERIEWLRATVQINGSPYVLSRLARTKEEYLEAQQALAKAFNDPRYKNQLLKIRIKDASR